METTPNTINRFIIMSVEQYAYSVNKNSGSTYATLKNKGIIDELVDDYEDMHGMSTYSINEYISERLGMGLDDLTTSPKDRHVLSKTILISQVVELIANKYKISIEEARNRFYESRAIQLLDDDETGLYGESALYLLSLYERELN